jgi:hypothetical protein
MRLIGSVESNAPKKPDSHCRPWADDRSCAGCSLQADEQFTTSAKANGESKTTRVPAQKAHETPEAGMMTTAGKLTQSLQTQGIGMNNAFQQNTAKGVG